jgi:hypothetical protein
MTGHRNGIQCLHKLLIHRPLPLQTMSQNTNLTPSTSNNSDLSQKDEELYYLWCWLFLDEVDLAPQEKLSRNVFSIKISRDSSFEDLGEAIKQKRSNRLKDLDTADIKIWAVDSPLLDGGADINEVIDRVTGEAISGATKLKVKFGNERTNSEHLHIVVRKRGTPCLPPCQSGTDGSTSLYPLYHISLLALFACHSLIYVARCPSRLSHASLFIAANPFIPSDVLLTVL